MSLKTWKEEFYPVKAEDVKPGLDSIEHSLTKWKGALPENLKRHACRYSFHHIDDDKQAFKFDDFTCALCQNHDCTPKEGFYSDESLITISICPIESYAGIPCCEGTPLSIFCTSENNPQPMIELLQSTKEWYIKNHGISK